MRALMRVIGLALVASRGSAQSPAPEEGPSTSLRAARAVTRPVLDGRLTDSVWFAAPIGRNFRQVEPRQGEAARFGTEVRVLYDDHALYVGAVLRDSGGRAALRIPDMRRDFGETSHDLFGVIIDTFRDGRSSIAFFVNPYGAQRDVQALDDNGRLIDVEWDAVWHARTAISDSAWSVEIAIPWSTLRYPAGAAEWGINFTRVARRANETSGWSPWPRSYTGFRMSYAGRLTEIDPPPPTTNMRVQPYVVQRYERASVASDRSHRMLGDIGGDVKWALTPNTVVDATFNTDFAQADADVQQVNLSRFSVFFPEKRQFFLENASLFALGNRAFGGEPFFSRRIGLDDLGRPVPIDAGLRLTSRSPERSLAMLAVRQRESDVQSASTVALGRVVQNLGAENRVGAMVVSRTDAGRDTTSATTNLVAALDGFARPTRTSYVRAMIAHSFTTGDGGEGTHAFMHAASSSSRGYFGWIQAYIGNGYRANTGFVPRENLMLTSPAITLDWRPAWQPGFVRTLQPGFSTSVYHRASDLRFQEHNTRFSPLRMTFHDGGQLNIWHEVEQQHLERAFTPVPGVTIDSGRYGFSRTGVTYQPDLSRALWAWVTIASGGYFDGRRDQAIVRVRSAPSPHLALTFDYEGNRLRTVGRQRTNETTHLFYPELRLAANPRLQLVMLWQYSSVSRVESWNARISWEFRPLSHVHVVLNERRPRVLAADAPLPRERQVILKVSYLAQVRSSRSG